MTAYSCVELCFITIKAKSQFYVKCFEAQKIGRKFNFPPITQRLIAVLFFYTLYQVKDLCGRSKIPSLLTKNVL